MENFPITQIRGLFVYLCMQYAKRYEKLAYTGLLPKRKNQTSARGAVDAERSNFSKGFLCNYVNNLALEGCILTTFCRGRFFSMFL